MKPAALYTAMAGFLAVASTGAQAAMPADAVLDFTGTFSMDTGPVAGLVLTPIKSGPDGGITIGVTQDTNGHASHGGTKSHLQGGLDYEWNFFNNEGMHFTSSPIVVINQDVNSDGGFTKTLDFSGWRVTWNGIPSINMGGGLQDCGTSTDGICVNPANAADIAGTYDNGTGVATIVCGTADCPYGSSYTLTYNAVVPQADPSNFGNVSYGVNISGTILNPNGQPIANPESFVTIVDNPVTIDVTANDTQNPDKTMVTVTASAGNGSAVASTVDGTITYTPATGYVGADSFDYTVANTNGTSNAATDPVTVATNVAPVAVDDTANTSTAVLNNTSLTINVLANDTDSNNANDLPGGIDSASVTILGNTGPGTCTANSDGTITYSQTSPSVGGDATCTYQISDIDTVHSPFTATATLTVHVTATTSDWPTALDPNIIPVLAFDPGMAGSTPSSPTGSYFTMEVNAGLLTYTYTAPGPDGGLIIGHEQPATGSHSQAPNGTEKPGFTAPWVFFSNTGFDLTRNGGITGNPDGTLDFHTKYVVTWNGIPVINLGGSSQFPEDLGFATINCTPAPCENDSTFTLDYAAHVEDIQGQPESNFKGVAYTLHMEGTVKFLDGTPQTSQGTVSSLTRLMTADVAVDSDVLLQCVGDCFDYTISGVTPSSTVSVVLPLAGGVRNNSVWRILDNGAWRNFDTSGGDTVQSAPFIAGVGGMECPAPDDAAYHALTKGDQCIELSILDNGLNDLNATLGTISDPSGLGSGGTAGGGGTFVDTRTSSTSGCSLINGGNTNPLQRGDWFVLAGFIAWLGWNRNKRNQH